MQGDTQEVKLLLSCGSAESRQKTFAGLFQQHRNRLRLMLELRLDPRLQRRIDPSDVIQEAYLEAARRLDAYLKDLPMPFYLWLHRLARQRLLALHRHHFLECRDVCREVRIWGEETLETSSAALATHLLREEPSPSGCAVLAEIRAQLREALERLDPVDREVLALRHFEQLSFGEVAKALGIEASAASKRYYRALGRLKKIVSGPGGIPKKGRE